MRVISQDGDFDFPYDNVIFKLDKDDAGFSIVAYAVGRVGICIGTFTDGDRAKKAFDGILMSAFANNIYYKVPGDC